MLTSSSPGHTCCSCCRTVFKGNMWHYDPQFTFYPPVAQVWERRDVISECQELHSLLPNSWGAECRHPDELLWGDYCQSLGEYIQMVFTCGQLDNLAEVTVVHPSVDILCEVEVLAVKLLNYQTVLGLCLLLAFLHGYLIFERSVSEMYLYLFSYEWS